MKLILLKTNLKEGLDTICRVTGENTNLPILKNVLIQGFNNQIKISATNLELAISCIVSGKIIEGNGITIPANTLISIVNNLIDERVNLESDGSSLVIKSDNYEARIQGMNHEDFPLLPQIKNKEYFFKINSGLFRDSLARVVRATQFSDWRQELNGVLFDFNTNNLNLVATDSFRLAKKVILSSQFESNWKEERIIIPLKTVEELIRVLKDDQMLGIYFDKSQIVFVGNDLEIISRVIEGRFPDYEAIIPNDFDIQMTLEKDNLINALKLAGIFSSRVNDVNLKIDDSQKAIEIHSSNSQLGENKYLLPVKCNKSMPGMVFNWKYFMDGLKMISNKDIFIGVNGEDKPVLLKSLTDQSLIYLLMPIKM